MNMWIIRWYKIAWFLLKCISYRLYKNNVFLHVRNWIIAYVSSYAAKISSQYNCQKNYCPWGDIFHASIYYIFALIHFRSIPLICKWVGMQSWIRIGICITLHGFCFRVNIWQYILFLWLCKSNWIYFNSFECSSLKVAISIFNI